VEGRVNLGTAVRVRSPWKRLCIAVAVVIEHSRGLGGSHLRSVIDVVLRFVSLGPPCYYLTLTMDSLPPTQATDSSRATELKMPPATSRPNPKVDSWSTIRRIPVHLTRPMTFYPLNCHCEYCNCKRSPSRKVNYRQLSIVSCTQLMTLLPNG